LIGATVKLVVLQRVVLNARSTLAETMPVRDSLDIIVGRTNVKNVPDNGIHPQEKKSNVQKKSRERTLVMKNVLKSMLLLAHVDLITPMVVAKNAVLKNCAKTVPLILVKTGTVLPMATTLVNQVLVVLVDVFGSMKDATQLLAHVKNKIVLQLHAQNWIVNVEENLTLTTVAANDALNVKNVLITLARCILVRTMKNGLVLETNRVATDSGKTLKGTKSNAVKKYLEDHGIENAKLMMIVCFVKRMMDLLVVTLDFVRRLITVMMRGNLLMEIGGIFTMNSVLKTAELNLNVKEFRLLMELNGKPVA